MKNKKFHFELLNRKLNFNFFTFNFLTWSQKIKSYTSSYLEVEKWKISLRTANSMVKLLLFRVTNSMVKLLFFYLRVTNSQLQNIIIHLKLLTGKLKKQNVDLKSLVIQGFFIETIYYTIQNIWNEYKPA